jgi:hypothetical protein
VITAAAARYSLSLTGNSEGVARRVGSPPRTQGAAQPAHCGTVESSLLILSDRLPSPARNAILDDLHAYLTTVLDREMA